MQRILAAVDTSENAAAVIAQAVELATSCAGRLRLLRVLPGKGGLDEVGRVEEAEDALRAQGELIPEAQRDGVMVGHGEPAEAICDAARTYGADVVVIGAHAYHLGERVLGTTAARVVDRLDRPVLVARRPRRHRETEERPSGIPSAESPTLLGAAGLAGAASGAVAGVVGGPPGILLGTTIGAAAGLLAGKVLDLVGHRDAAHDRDLDDAIGVTSRDLGAKEQAQAGIRELEGGAEADAADVVPRAADQRAQHKRLEAMYQALLDAYRDGDWNDVRDEWAVFEPALRGHMELEERTCFPLFRTESPAEVAALEGQHAEIRRVLETLAVNLELHAIPYYDAELLVRALREHGAREEKLFYPWLDGR